MKHLLERILVAGGAGFAGSHLRVDRLFNLACPAGPRRYQDDPTRRKPDAGRAIGTLDWTPHVSLWDGLVATIAYIKDLLRGNPASRISVFQP